MENLALRKRAATSASVADCHDILNDLGNDCNGAVDKQTVGVTKEDEATDTAVGFAGFKVGSIAVNI